MGWWHMAYGERGGVWLTNYLVRPSTTSTPTVYHYHTTHTQPSTLLLNHGPHMHTRSTVDSRSVWCLTLLSKRLEVESEPWTCASHCVVGATVNDPLPLYL